MNEGKPAKAKWWSRPRPHDLPATAEGATPTGDGETPIPLADAVPDDVRRRSGRGDESGGDFELRAPEDAPDTGRDFELRAPEDAPATEGDFELARPADLAADLAAAPAAERPAVPATERPRPLHDPDPYSTPPYGEPGPWAPAPPVQHPATPTPTHGTATPAPPTASTALPPATAPAPSPSAPPPPLTAAPAAPVGSAPPGAADGLPGAPAAAFAPSTAHEPPAVPAQARPPGAAAAPAPPHAAPPAAPQGPAQGAPPSAPSVASAPSYADAPPAPPLSTPWKNYDPWAPLPAAPLQQNGAAVPTEDRRRRRVKKVLVGGAALVALVSGGVGGVVGAYLERDGGVGAVELPQAGAESAGRAPDSVAGIAARALPSVVTLHVSGAEESGTGTGFVLDDRGHILTNNHVVDAAASDGDTGEISVTFHSGDTAKATVVGRDSGYDLAVVKVSGVSGLKPLTLGNSDNVQVGDPVVAIGAPFDLAGTVTSGIISAKERPITAGGESGDASDVSYVDALQTDAPINPGNSGGPLLDSRARVIGINSAIRSADSGSDPEGGQSGSIGLGFAIPINQGKRVAEELINTGRATHPVIGVTLDMDYAGDGARVGTKGSDGGPAVTVGGAGDRAGIEAGDVITEVDGQRIHSGEELIVKTRAHRPGDRLELTVERDGKERTITLVLGSSGGSD
ncbi:S1C family serine protease [Streptomyces sp. V4I2]|uniref:S1C family serine protease n=1 Tax=Streptomyces sp. V4I2 TaxID=3042280 RepID=UPI002781ECE1|nr:trypsin-like peptidase domain-containing protein [Streptomyces sp. V4I2]MDQ1048400.1 putative serine protease PepD [Streptomyces sp. V4I2]